MIPISERSILNKIKNHGPKQQIPEDRRKLFLKTKEDSTWTSLLWLALYQKSLLCYAAQILILELALKAADRRGVRVMLMWERTGPTGCDGKSFVLFLIQTRDIVEKFTILCYGIKSNKSNAS